METKVETKMETKVENKSICNSCNRKFKKVDEFPKFKVLSVKKCEFRKFMIPHTWEMPKDSITNPEILDGVPKEELKKLPPIGTDFNNIEKVYIKDNLVYRKFEQKYPDKNGDKTLVYFDVSENIIEKYRELYEKKSEKIIKLFTEGEIKNGKVDKIYKIKKRKKNKENIWLEIRYKIKSLGENKFSYTYKLYEMGRAGLGAFGTSMDYICDLVEVVFEGIKNIEKNQIWEEKELKSKIYELVKEYNKINTNRRMIIDSHTIGCCCTVCWYEFGSKDDKRDNNYTSVYSEIYNSDKRFYS